MIYGHGRLLIDHRDVGHVEYKINVTAATTDGRPGYARGYIYAHQSVIDDAMAGGRVEIVRNDNGHAFGVTLISTLGDGRADIDVVGEPGPENG